MTDIDCRRCEGRPCNRKGKPSVMKDSAFCQTQRNIVNEKGISRLQQIKDWMSGLF